MKDPRILIVEDEHALALALAAAVRHAGAASDLAPTAARAGEFLNSGTRYAAMVLDIGLPDQNGLAFLGSLDPGHRLPTIVITAHGEIQNTIAARKLGVVDFLTKPLDFGAFRDALRRLIEARPAKRERHVEQPEGAAYVGAAASMRPVFQQIAHCCASDDSVLVRGETGTGKSHTARLIQRHSLREGPAATLMAGPATTTDELTAALAEAAGGVLVLEEVALLGPDMQAELVRRIEAAPKERFPRLIVTTRDDLRARAGEGTFRSDLFYRLQVLEVHLPPLRARMDDLPALVSYFLGQLAPERALDVTPQGLARLGAHEWPGNLRELRNAVAYALTVNAGASMLEAGDFPAYLGEIPAAAGGEALPAALVRALDSWLEAQFQPRAKPVYRDLAGTLEAELIRRLLRRYDGKLARMASALQANRTTLRRKLKE